MARLQVGSDNDSAVGRTVLNINNDIPRVGGNINITAPTSFKFAHGTYTGNGVITGDSQNIVSSPSFLPKLIFIRADIASSEGSGLMRSDKMLKTRQTAGLGSAAGYDGIWSFNSNGFTVRFTSTETIHTNKSGVEYHYWMIGGDNVVSDFYVSTDATQPVTISGLPHTPVMVMALPIDSASDYVTFKITNMPSNESSTFSTQNTQTDHITGIITNGFTLGTSVRVNPGGSKVVPYVTFGSAPNLHVGTYTGDGGTGSNFPLTAMAFNPSIAHVKGYGGGTNAVFKTLSLTTDKSLTYGAGNSITNGIKSLTPVAGKFQVGNNGATNTNLAVYYFFAMMESVVTDGLTINWNVLGYVEDAVDIQWSLTETVTSNPLNLLWTVDSATDSKPRRISAILYNKDNDVQGVGIINKVISLDIDWVLDEVSNFKVVIPLTDRNAQSITLGNYIKFYQEGVGRIYSGKVDDIEKNGKTGEMIISGLGLGVELLERIVYPGTKYEDIQPITLETKTLALAGWSVSSTSTNTERLTFTPGKPSVWEAWRYYGDIIDCHIRENKVTERQLDFGPFGVDSGVVVVSPGTSNIDYGDDTYGILLEQPTQKLSSAELYNVVYPLGKGSGLFQSTLKQSSYRRNWIKNPSFEDGWNNWGLVEVGSGGTVEPSSTRSVHGDYSLRINKTSTTAGTTIVSSDFLPTPSSFRLKSDIAVQTLRMSAYAYLNTGSDTWKCKFRTYDINKTEITGSSTGTWNTVGSWINATCSLNTDGVTAIWYVKVFFESNTAAATGEVWIDMPELYWDKSEANQPYSIHELRLPGVEQETFMLMDIPSILQYGQKEYVLTSEETSIGPHSPDYNDYISAANILYIIGTRFLEYHKDSGEEYEIKTLNVPNRVQVGDKISIRYNGQIIAEDNKTLNYINLNSSLYIIKQRRSYKENGEFVDDFDVSSSDQVRKRGIYETILEFYTKWFTDKTAFVMRPYNEVYHRKEFLENLYDSKFYIQIPDNLMVISRVKLVILAAETRVLTTTVPPLSAIAPVTVKVGSTTVESGIYLSETVTKSIDITSFFVDAYGLPEEISGSNVVAIKSRLITISTTGALGGIDVRVEVEGISSDINPIFTES